MGITYSYLPMEISNRGTQPRVGMIVLPLLMVLIKKSVRNILVFTFKKWNIGGIAVMKGR